jgi:hypothetical protein
MFSIDDEYWKHLVGGYKIPFDPRPSLRKLENQQDTATAWEELWEELHHQGAVGEASYAAVPELVRIHRSGGAPDWNLYAMVAIIELARTAGTPSKRTPRTWPSTSYSLSSIATNSGDAYYSKWCKPL